MEKVGSLIQGILAKATSTKPVQNGQNCLPVAGERPISHKETVTPPVHLSPTKGVAKRPFQRSSGEYTPRPDEGSKRPFRPRRSNRPSSAPTSIELVLKSVLKNNGLEEQIDRYKFVLHWSEIVGEKLEKMTKPECLRRDVLVVRVKSSVWAQELSFQKFEILERLKPFLASGQVVNDISFYVAG